MDLGIVWREDMVDKAGMEKPNEADVCIVRVGVLVKL